MSKVNPFVGLFVAIATLMAAFFVPVLVLLIDHGERLARLEERFEIRMDALEARIDTIEARVDALDTAIAALSRDVAATNERMARIEGTVAGALGRPFPERMAEGPGDKPAPAEAEAVDG